VVFGMQYRCGVALQIADCEHHHLHHRQCVVCKLRGAREGLRAGTVCAVTSGRALVPRLGSAAFFEVAPTVCGRIRSSSGKSVIHLQAFPNHNQRRSGVTCSTLGNHRAALATCGVGTDAMAPEQRRELAVFVFLAFILAPVLAVLIVSGFGFCVWMYQLLAGPPGAP